MTNLRKSTVLLGAIAGLAIAGPGCGGGDGTGPGGSAGSAGDGGDGGAGGGTGGTTTSPTGGAGGGTGGTGGTGGSSAVDQGAQGTAFVSGGTSAKSTNYSMVFTLGQSTPNQGRSKSSGYTMQGGLIGATGSLK